MPDALTDMGEPAHSVVRPRRADPGGGGCVVNAGGVASPQSTALDRQSGRAGNPARRRPSVSDFPVHSVGHGKAPVSRSLS